MVFGLTLLLRRLTGPNSKMEVGVAKAVLRTAIQSLRLFVERSEVSLESLER